MYRIKHHKATRQRCRTGRDDEIILNNDKVEEGAKEQERSSENCRKGEVDKEGGIRFKTRDKNINGDNDTERS